MVRTYISEENKATLEELFASGMDAKGKQCSKLHDEAVSRTGLPLQVVKDWVGNKRKVVDGRKYEYKKTVYSKGITSYNCFVREKKDEFSDMTEWAPAWSRLSEEEKKIYKDKAREEQRCPTKDDIPKLLKQLTHKIVELEKLGVDLAIVGVDSNDGKQILVGGGKIAFFLKTQDALLQKIFSHHSTGSGSSEAKLDPKVLRQKAQKHMNYLYSQAVGEEKQFPYKKVREGSITIHGFPDSLMPIRTVSNYGEDNINLILSVQEISIEIPDSIPEDISTGNSGHYGTELFPMPTEAETSLLAPLLITDMHIPKLAEQSTLHTTTETTVLKKKGTKRKILKTTEQPAQHSSQKKRIKLAQTKICTHTLNTSTKTHNTPTKTDNTLPETHNTPTEADNTLPETHNTPTETDNTLPETHNTPTETNNTLPETHNTLTETHTHNTPTETHNTPTETHNTPTETETHNTPTETHNTPTETHNTPIETHNTPTEKHNTPTETHNTPTETETHNTPTETHNTPTETHNTPTETHNTLTETHNTLEITTLKRKDSKRKKSKLTKNSKNEYIVKALLDTRRDGDTIKYLVHWDGYSHNENSWEPACNISSVLIEQFYSRKIVN